MKFTIITTVLNGIETISNTIDSVKKNFPDCEHIVIDAGSTDGTLKYLSDIKGIVLVRAEGASIAVAWNHGIKISSGDYIGILNADDFYSDGLGVYLVEAINRFNHGDIFVGDVQLISQGNQSLRKFKGQVPNRYNLFFGIPFLHPSTFVKKEFYQQFGVFKTDLQVAFDAEWILRSINNKAIFAKYNGLTVMRDGGISKTKEWIGFGERLQSLSDLRFSKIYFISALLVKAAVEAKRWFVQFCNIKTH
jgi:glycosyltransferase involved in cell wall biosynthesis